jgi:DNA mismatch repair protein MutS
VSVQEIDGKVVFLRKLARGGSAHSFGIHVAKLAGMPRSIVKRADEVLHHLEEASKRNGGTDGAQAAPEAFTIPDAPSGMQLSFFQLDDPLLSQLRDRILGLDIDNLTPLQALTTLHDIRQLLKGK